MEWLFVVDFVATAAQAPQSPARCSARKRRFRCKFFCLGKRFPR